MSIAKPEAGDKPLVGANGVHAPKGDPGPKPSYIADRDYLQYVPAELRERRQWVVWRYRVKGDDWTKVPFAATIPPSKGSTTDPSTWRTFDEALDVLNRFHDPKARDCVDGIGFVFSPDDPYVGIDFDDALDDGGFVKEWAKPYLDRLPTYAEISPSARGFKLIARGSKPGGSCKKKGIGPGKAAIEIYEAGRYFTMTGDCLGEQPTGETVENIADAVSALHADLFPPKPVKPKSAAKPQAAALESDDDLLRRMFAAKNGADVEALFKGDTSRNHHDESSADLALCNALAFWFRGDEAAIDRVFRRSGLLRDKWDERRGETTYGAMTIAKALEGRTEYYEPRKMTTINGRSHETNGKASDGPPPDTQARPALPAVEINVDRHRVLAETLAVLPSDLGLFCRGDVLVRVDVHKGETAKLAGGVEVTKADGLTRIIPVGEAGLSCRITALIDFFVWGKTKSGEDAAKPAHPPTWLVKATAENGNFPGVRPLRGVAEIPFPRADGSLVMTPGYDRKTGIFYSPSIALDPIPDFPTRLDAEAAARLILALVEQFPFASADDKAVWFSALLTAIARPGIEGPVPGNAFVGNRAGTGKGKLIDCIGVILNNRPVPTTSYPEDRDEMRKVKTAFALDPTPLVHLDNIEEGRFYGGGVLDSALTSMTVNDRILGVSKTTSGLELRSVWFVSGNGIVPRKDAYRRWLVCNLLTALECPEERGDLKIPDLLNHVREHRAELVRAALVVLKAHAAAGRPTDGWAPLGSFEEWDKVVRGAVWFATGLDCNATRKKVAAEAPERMDHLALLDAWASAPDGGKNGNGITVESAFRLASSVERDHPPKCPELTAALMRFSKDARLPTSRQIGYILRAVKGRVMGGQWFTNKPDGKHAVLWSVEGDKTSAEPRSDRRGDEGDKGDDFSPRTRDYRTHDNMMAQAPCANASRNGRNHTPYPPIPPEDIPVCDCMGDDCLICNP